MKLYHFTTAAIAQTIRVQGCNPSSLAVPGGKTAKVTVVSLTSNPDPNDLIGKTLGDGSALSGRNLDAWRAANPGSSPTYIPCSANTIEARITFEIPESDPLLKRFTKANARKLGYNETQFIKFLEEGGGVIGEWWIYQGILSQTYISEIMTNYPTYDQAI